MSTNWRMPDPPQPTLWCAACRTWTGHSTAHHQPAPPPRPYRPRNRWNLLAWLLYGYRLAEWQDAQDRR